MQLRLALSQVRIFLGNLHSEDKAFGLLVARETSGFENFPTSVSFFADSSARYLDNQTYTASTLRALRFTSNFVLTNYANDFEDLDGTADGLPVAVLLRRISLAVIQEVIAVTSWLLTATETWQDYTRRTWRYNQVFDPKTQAYLVVTIFNRSR